ncbi:MAG: FAD-binding monooxygenase [Candidatus Binataceae bacterium]|jgi:2-polyprenyl-6-methoxyphenol hydroxylase-like FAD-dependent oxidoreductase
MPNHLGSQAVVIGGSIAGLTSARVLSDFFDHVTVLERDPIAAHPAARKSIPQGNHLHVLMLGGQRVLSSLYPGFTDRLEELGSVRFRFVKDFAFYLPDRKSHSLSGSCDEPRDLGIDGYSQSRELLEHCVRQSTLELSGISFESGVSVQGLVYDGARVRGLRCDHSGDARTLEADLVVDAGGRGSRAPRWLTELGFEAPSETSIGVDFAYASARFRIPASYSEPEKVMLFGGPPPRYPNGGGISAIENETWQVSLAGRFGNYPPADREGFFAFARSLPTPRLYEFIKDAEQVTDLYQHRFPTSVQRHYERLSAFPERFVVLGDAICSFNPVYGQGMSSALLQVQALQRLLNERIAKDPGAPLDHLATAFFPRAADVIAAPWILASGFDFTFPQTKGERPPNMSEGAAYFRALDALSADDPEVHRTLLEVFQLVRPLMTLWQEPLFSRVNARLRHPSPKESA